MSHFLLPDGTHWEPDLEPPRPLSPAQSALAGDIHSFDYETEVELESWGRAVQPVVTGGQFDFDYYFALSVDVAAVSPRTPQEDDGFYSYDFELEIELDRNRSDHVVLFHADEADRIAKVAAAIADRLDEEQHTVIVATAEHANALLARLPAASRERAQKEGRLVVQDARRLLSSFMRNGMPDPALFEQNVASDVRECAQRSTRLLAYGEMTTLLWSEGNIVAALQLERLWNQLLSEASFSLLCAYPLAEVPEETAGFAELCELHSAAHVS